MSVLPPAALATAALLPVLGALLGRGRQGSDVQVLRRSLAEVYQPTAPPPAPIPLQSPVGLVGVDTDGLLLHIGEGAPDFRRVPWSGVRHVLPVRRGEVTIYVARFGPIVGPRQLAGAIVSARGPALR